MSTRLRTEIHGFRGQVFVPGHAGYDSARSLWKGVDRKPAAIFQCEDVSDIQRVVEYARSGDLPFAITNSGHDVAAKSFLDGGIILSTARLRRVAIDPARRLARVEAGVRWGELGGAAYPLGLATTGASTTSVGVAGFVLHGGYGLLMRRCGAGCDNIAEIELVTADGNCHTVNGQSNPDLFWAMRGAGSNFGVVSAITLHLHAIPRVIAGVINYPASQAREVLQVYREITAVAPEELVTDFYYMVNPDGTHGVGIGVCFSGSQAEADRALAPLAALRRPWHDSIAEMSTLELQKLHDHSTPRGPRYHLRGYHLREMSDSTIGVILEHCRRISSPLSRVFIEHLGGAIARVSPGATSFHGRDAMYSFLAVAGWASPAHGAEHIAWNRALSDAIGPLAMPGGYVNYFDEDEDGRIPAAYGPGYARLVALKRQYDPTNLFRANANIPPVPSDTAS